jgi:hypothetical protein
MLAKPLPTIPVYPKPKPSSSPLPTTPTAASYAQADLFRNAQLGNLWTEFEAINPDPRYGFDKRNPAASWKIITPKTAPPVARDLPQVIKNIMKSTWKLTEPAWDNVRGVTTSGGRGPHAHSVVIGNRPGLPTLRPTPSGITIGKHITGAEGGAVPWNASSSVQYASQVRPTSPKVAGYEGLVDGYGNEVVKFPNDSEIATDWNLMKWVQRRNAVTFRGDSRSPYDVITKAKGFHPPNSRTDRGYLEKNIYATFADYLKRRYGREISQADFLKAVDSTLPDRAKQSLLIDYMMWRKITEREAAHLGRMVSSEFLKGYISTAISIDTSLHFATGYGARPGWLYLTVVHSGFEVPDGQSFWGAEEAEIAQWGPIPAERIVGFVHVQADKIPDGPIFIRRSFRAAEPEAFEHMFKVMSGWIP